MPSSKTEHVPFIEGPSFHLFERDILKKISLLKQNPDVSLFLRKNKKISKTIMLSTIVFARVIIHKIRKYTTNNNDPSYVDWDANSFKKFVTLMTLTELPIFLFCKLIYLVFVYKIATDKVNKWIDYVAR